MGLEFGLKGGVAVAKDWLVLRANLTHTNTYERTLSNRTNFAGIFLHLGVRFRASGRTTSDDGEAAPVMSSPGPLTSLARVV